VLSDETLDGGNGADVTAKGGPGKGGIKGC
jgi:hypothetical protein